MAGTAVYQYQRQWTFLQQTYLKTYISTGRTWLKSAPYPILYRVEGKQQRAAVDDDLSDPAVVSGKAKLQWERGVYNNAELARWLETAIYGGESPWSKLWEWIWKVGALVFGVGFLFSAPRDYQRQRVRKYGRRTKGPELVTAAQFNGANHSDGIGFLTRKRRTLGEFVLRREGNMVRVPRERESSHCMMMGDTGAGKSSLIRQILMGSVTWILTGMDAPAFFVQAIAEARMVRTQSSWTSSSLKLWRPFVPRWCRYPKWDE
jgi:hypothetical protein